MFLCVYMYVCVCVCICMCVCVFVYVCMYVWVYVWVYLCVCVLPDSFKICFSHSGIPCFNVKCIGYSSFALCVYVLLLLYINMVFSFVVFIISMFGFFSFFI